MKKVFDGPTGLVEYDLETTLYGSRRIVVGDATVGMLLMLESGQKWLIADETVRSPLFSSQRTAAEYWLMWLALKERSECPYCNAQWTAGPVWTSQGGESSVVWTCPRCNAVEEHKRWPPPQEEEEE